MIKYSLLDIRTLSLLGERGTFGKIMCDLAKNKPNLIASTADQGVGSALKGFREKYPKNFLNFGISEQNAIGVCAAMANEGFDVFLAMQATFASTRCLDEVRVAMSYMKLPVKLIGIFSGVTQSDCGPTHYALNDFAIFRSLPNIVILSPSDALMTAKCIEYVASESVPTYIRLTGMINTPIIYKSDFDFELGKAISLKEGSDICIIATGSMVKTALNVSDNIEKQLGLSAKVFDFHTIKPFDEDTVKSLKGFRLVVTMEEHSIFGGLGSTVAEILVRERNNIPLEIIGARDEFKATGEYKDVISDYGLNEESVTLRIINRISKLEN